LGISPTPDPLGRTLIVADRGLVEEDIMQVTRRGALFRAPIHGAQTATLKDITAAPALQATGDYLEHKGGFELSGACSWLI
jgi:hypothetical protein